MSQIYKNTSGGGGGGGITTILGDIGSISGTMVTIYADNAAVDSGGSAGATVLFQNSDTTSTFIVTDSNHNTIMGANAGQTGITGTDNSGFGFAALNSLTSGIQNSAFSESFGNLNTGSQNSGFGFGSGNSFMAGSQNSCLGVSSGGGDGNYNVFIGYEAGAQYDATESNNIIIGAGNEATAGDNNTIRIGVQGSSTGEQNTCFIAGISGVTVATPETVTINPSTGQLGVLSMSGSMVLISSQTAAASVSLLFTGITSVYDQYMFVWYGVTVSDTAVVLEMQYSTDGGSTFITTGYDDNGFLCTQASLFQNNNASYGGVPLTTFANTSTTYPAAGNIRLDQPTGTTFNKTAFRTGYEYQSPEGFWTYEGSANVCTETAAINSFQIIPSSGTITTGVFKLYGIVN